MIAKITCGMIYKGSDNYDESEYATVKTDHVWSEDELKAWFYNNEKKYAEGYGYSVTATFFENEDDDDEIDMTWIIVHNKEFFSGANWMDTDIQIVEIDDDLYALNGWNGETYGHCWKCIDRFTADPDGKEYEIRPVYDWERWNEEDGAFEDEDGTIIDGVIGYEVA